MKKASILLAFILCLSLLGCDSEEPEATYIQAQAAPALSYGVMEYEKLQALPWDSGRTEATSFHTMAETELGYYLEHDNLLFYMDKADMRTWVPVCSAPECEHTDHSCDAYMKYREFLVQDGRIYYQASSRNIPGQSAGVDRLVLASMALNGKDKRFEYALSDQIMANSVSTMSLLTPRFWFQNVVTLHTDGSRTVSAYRAGKDGWEQLSVRDASDNWTMDAMIMNTSLFHLRGDLLVHNSALDLDWNIYFRYTEDGSEKLDLSGFSTEYAYLSGNALRYFQTNDGYYDMDIRTGETVKLADPRMENSQASVILPNCIVESTLIGTTNFPLRSKDTVHEMEVFDGESWRTVTLPEELANARPQSLILINAVSSDSIFFVCRDMESYGQTYASDFYRIDLTKKELKAELIFQYTPAWLEDAAN